jgi:Lrp/AsnC family transcriptional regulator for asnA, asnC and gidA
MSKPQLDDLDRRIIGLLTRDARVSNRQLAHELGVTEGTVRGRIKRLEADNLIRFSAVSNVAYSGAPQVVLIGIHAQLDQVQSLCQRISAMQEIRCVIAMMGRYDILCVGLFGSLTQIVEVANNRILSMPGVRHVETSIAVETVKYDHRVAKITDRRG